MIKWARSMYLEGEADDDGVSRRTKRRKNILGRGDVEPGCQATLTAASISLLAEVMLK